MKNLFRRKVYQADSNTSGLNRVLGTWDIVFFGIAAIIGAGSFSSLGEAIFKGGPGVFFLYGICGIACSFTALCYAEFASRIPTAGSAYTYAYASFGELIAWIIGWALIMEYSFGNIYVSFSWSDYMTNLLERVGIYFPEWLSTSYSEARRAFQQGSKNENLLRAWSGAPIVGGMRFIIDLPALIINILITWICYCGVSESKKINNFLVLLKLFIILLVMGIGAIYINTENWTPISPSTGLPSLMPNGFSGVMSAISGVFFAYVGFDALSILAEETKNPQKTLPRGMIISLILCTIIYILLILILTGMVDYRKFDGVGDPLSFIFEKSNANLPWMEFLVSLAAIIAITSVLLVFQMGQPRIWMVMSRDGLLPQKFEEISPKYKTPSFSTIMTGLFVGVPILFTDKVFVLDFTSIGTIFAFVLVCGGVLLLPPKTKSSDSFSLPVYSSRLLYPLIFIVGIGFLWKYNPDFFKNLTEYSDPKEREFRISISIYLIIIFLLACLTIWKNFSLIPLLGLSSCLYLLTGMSHENWFWFGVWFLIGLGVYFTYGRTHSKLKL